MAQRNSNQRPEQAGNEFRYATDTASSNDIQ